MTVHVYRVPDVSCEHCIKSISDALGGIAGVQSVDVNLTTKLVTVESTEAVQDAVLREGIEEAGYDIAAA